MSRNPRLFRIFKEINDRACDDLPLRYWDSKRVKKVNPFSRSARRRCKNVLQEHRDMKAAIEGWKLILCLRAFWNNHVALWSVGAREGVVGRGEDAREGRERALRGWFSGRVPSLVAKGDGIRGLRIRRIAHPLRYRRDLLLFHPSTSLTILSTPLRTFSLFFRNFFFFAGSIILLKFLSPNFGTMLWPGFFAVLIYLKRPIKFGACIDRCFIVRTLSTLFLIVNWFFFAGIEPEESEVYRS